MEQWRAYRNAFPGAVYLHRDRTFVVTSVDLAAGEAILEDRAPGYYTEPITQSLVEELIRIEEKEARFGAIGLSSVQLTSTTIGARKKAQDGGQLLEDIPVEMPPLSYQTLGIVFDFESGLLPIDDPRSSEALHGAEHALAATAPLIAGCDARDLGSGWFIVCPETMAPRLIVFDAAPGGLGFAQALSRALPEWFRLAVQLLEGCPCDEGCPKCLLSPSCEVSNQGLDKGDAIKLLKVMASSISD
jgi:DEAD/DEAH box helicase domain-containing protein